MRNQEELRRRAVEATETLDLVCELVGRITIQHEWANAEIRRALRAVFENSEILFEEDITQRLLYSHSASELRRNFVSVLSARFKGLTPALQSLEEFSDWTQELSAMLAAENNVRNHIVHSEYFRDAESEGLDEILGSFLVSNRKGRYAVRRFRRDWLLDFIGFQQQLIQSIRLLADDMAEGADLFEQAELIAPDEAAMHERMEARAKGLATPEWLVGQYLGEDLLAGLRRTYQAAKLNELQNVYTDEDHGRLSFYRTNSILG